MTPRDKTRKRRNENVRVEKGRVGRNANKKQLTVLQHRR
jgi:hypothetical protein